MRASAEQSSSPGAPIAVTLTSARSCTTEIETSTSYAADVLPGYTTTLPLGPCQYSLAAVLALRVESPGADGNLPVKAEYQDLKVTNWSCRELEQKKWKRAARFRRFECRVSGRPARRSRVSRTTVAIVSRICRRWIVIHAQSRPTIFGVLFQCCVAALQSRPLRR